MIENIIGKYDKTNDFVAQENSEVEKFFEENVYYLDHEFPDDPVIYDTFEDFLDNILSLDSDL